ncbi:MAG: hypothetical protein ACLUKN_13640 [Bacilli bacterium]
MPINTAISLQPDFQIFVNQGGRNDSKAAYIVNARLEVNFKILPLT